MVLIPKPFYGSLKRYWRRRRYQKLSSKSSTVKKKVKIKRLKAFPRGFWRSKTVPKLQPSTEVSPFTKLWANFKTGYIEMMVNFADKVKHFNNTENVFGGKWMIPRARRIADEEVEGRLVYEIYKDLKATRELSSS